MKKRTRTQVRRILKAEMDAMTAPERAAIEFVRSLPVQKVELLRDMVADCKEMMAEDYSEHEIAHYLERNYKSR
jgi:hypothetical protein